jgi:hypothetical protein
VTIEAKVILDSLAPNGARLTTFELTYPRFIHSELLTHRVFSRNAASSRAIPTPKKIERIRADRAKPSEWGINQKGMQSGGALDPEIALMAEDLWDEACDAALHHAEMLCGMKCSNCNKTFAPDAESCECGTPRLDLHKQVANRVLECFDHITVVLSTTKLRNHFKLRTEIDEITKRPLPDPTYFELATKWKAAFDSSTPKALQPGEWHLPYVSSDDVNSVLSYLGGDAAHEPGAVLEVLKKISVGRCARVSYMRQGQGDVEENVKLHDRLAKGGHWSPFEHVATPMGNWVPAKGVPDREPCDFCYSEVGPRPIELLQHAPDGVHTLTIVCSKCSYGHIHSGNIHGFVQYRKMFQEEAGGD